MYHNETKSETKLCTSKSEGKLDKQLICKPTIAKTHIKYNMGQI